MECKNNRCGSSHCSNQIIDLKMCRHCLVVKYCSDECRTIDWKSGHKNECGANSFSLKDFIPVKQSKSLGKGAYGVVQLVQHMATRKYYALKVIKKRNLTRSNSLKMMYREISVQKKLIHPNIIRLYGHVEDIDNLHLILEYAEKGNLFHYVRRRKKLSDEESCFFFNQVCIGIHYLHENSIIHRDLKPENILISQNSTVKICDFGWCAEGNGERSTYCGTLDYMAPEILRGHNYTNKVDIWALGILLFEMSHGFPPFDAKSEIDKSRLIRQGDFNFSDGVSRECQDLIKLILQDSPEKRPDINTILKHPWISKFAGTIYKDKFNIEDFAIGNQVHDCEFGEGIIVNFQGLICEISFNAYDREVIIPEFIRKNEKFSQTISTRSSQCSKFEISNEKDFDMKLSKNYPPSYNSPANSKGRPPRPQIVSIPTDIFQRKMNSEENSGFNSPMPSVNIRSESSKFEISKNNSIESGSSKFSSSSGEFKPTDSVLSVDLVAQRVKELEMLQLSLEGNKRQPIIMKKKAKKKSGFFSRLTGIFNLGCADR